MPARVSLITLGVDDLAKATQFYEKIGFHKSSASQESVTFLKAGGVILGREALLKDAQIDQGTPGTGAVALAQNLESEEAVDKYLDMVVSAGATILKPAQKSLLGRL